MQLYAHRVTLFTQPTDVESFVDELYDKVHQPPEVPAKGAPAAGVDCARAVKQSSPGNAADSSSDEQAQDPAQR